MRLIIYGYGFNWDGSEQGCRGYSQADVGETAATRSARQGVSMLAINLVLQFVVPMLTVCCPHIEKVPV